MAWSIAEVARMSNTTSRTLRHYHDIGLLHPAYVGSNGYRYYEREQLLRLQEILLLRNLGLSLPDVAALLEGEQDATTALRSHLQRLREAKERLTRLEQTVERTLLYMEREDIDMAAKDLFEGFQQPQYEQALIEHYGERAEAHIAESKQRTSDWGKEDYESSMSEFRDVLRKLASARAAGHDAGSAEVQEVIASHHAWLCSYWTPDRESYTGLGNLYVDDDRFRSQIDAEGPDLAEFLRDAMRTYGERSLR